MQAICTERSRGATTSVLSQTKKVRCAGPLNLLSYKQYTSVSRRTPGELRTRKALEEGRQQFFESLHKTRRRFGSSSAQDTSKRLKFRFWCYLSCQSRRLQQGHPLRAFFSWQRMTISVGVTEFVDLGQLLESNAINRSQRLRTCTVIGSRRMVFVMKFCSSA